MEIEKNEVPKELVDAIGPCSVDSMIREAVKLCWILLPKEARSPEGLRRQILRLVDRALKDMKDDAEAFGIRLPDSEE